MKALLRKLRAGARARPASAPLLTAPFLAATALAGGLTALLTAGWARAELTAPDPTPIVEDRTGGFLTEAHGDAARLGYWEVEGPLNPRVVRCLIEAEDRRFYRHPGVDARAVLRAAWNNLRGGERQGASTIAMQVARLQRPEARSLAGKLLEASTAFCLVRRFGREGVLRQYLKIVPQGNRIHGLAYAARRYFRKPLVDVSWGEAAVLASLPRLPGRLNLFSPWGLEAARRRAGRLLALMRERGQLTPEEHQAAGRELAAMRLPAREGRPFESTHYLLRLLEEMQKAGPVQYSRPVRASLDPGLQLFLQGLAEQAMQEQGRHGAQAMAALVADRSSGEVLGYLGSPYYYDRARAGAIDYARAPRSSGSILKPLLFAYGLDSGRFTPGSMLADLPFAVLGPRGEYRAANFDDAYLGPMLYRRALANSRNVPALRVLEGAGAEGFYSLCRRLGLARERREAAFYGYGLAIGGLYVTLEDLVAAYGALANDGRRFSLSWLQSGEQADARQGTAAAEPVLSEYAARTVTLFLSDDQARLPSFPRAGALEFPFPVAVKTGTSQGYRDAWCVAYSARYLVGVWLGNPDNRPMNRVAGIVAAGYAGRILSRLHPLQEQGIDAVPFPVPGGAEPLEVCALSGQQAGPDCPSRSVEYFQPAQAPRAACSVHRRFAVDRRDGSLASARTPARHVQVKAFTVLPPEYAQWSAQHGLGAAPQPPVTAAQSLRILYPQSGARYLLDPDTPRRFQSLPLRAEVLPPARLVLWYVDGRLAGSSPYPYVLRIPLQPGGHEVQAVVPGTESASEVVRIQVQ